MSLFFPVESRDMIRIVGELPRQIIREEAKVHADSITAGKAVCRRPHDLPGTGSEQSQVRESIFPSAGYDKDVSRLSPHRQVGRRIVYPNEVVERHLGVAATTRNWNTLCAICDILRAQLVFSTFETFHHHCFNRAE
jgi:hypothetical protein